MRRGIQPVALRVPGSVDRTGKVATGKEPCVWGWQTITYTEDQAATLASRFGINHALSKTLALDFDAKGGTTAKHKAKVLAKRAAHHAGHADWQPIYDSIIAAKTTDTPGDGFHSSYQNDGAELRSPSGILPSEDLGSDELYDGIDLRAGYLDPETGKPIGAGQTVAPSSVIMANKITGRTTYEGNLLPVAKWPKLHPDLLSWLLHITSRPKRVRDSASDGEADVEGWVAPLKPEEIDARVAKLVDDLVAKGKDPARFGWLVDRAKARLAEGYRQECEPNDPITHILAAYLHARNDARGRERIGHMRPLKLWGRRTGHRAVARAIARCWLEQHPKYNEGEFDTQYASLSELESAIGLGSVIDSGAARRKQWVCDPGMRAQDAVRVEAFLSALERDPAFAGLGPVIDVVRRMEFAPGAKWPTIKAPATLAMLPGAVPTMPDELPEKSKVAGEVASETDVRFLPFTNASGDLMHFDLRHRAVLKTNALKAVCKKGVYTDYMASLQAGATIYKGLTIDLAKPFGAIIGGKINTFEGFQVTARAGADDKLLVNFIWEVIAGKDRELFKYVMRWIAWKWQNKAKPTEVALVLQSESEGTGKSTLGVLLTRLFDGAAAKISDPRHLVGGFNGHLGGAAFVQVEEALFAGDPRHRGPLYDMIVNRTIRVEKKFVDSIEVLNTLAMLMCTNSEWAVPAGKDARRFAVIAVTTVRRGDVAYWTALHSALEDDAVIAAFAARLEAMNLGAWHPRQDIPKTAALMEQKLRSGDNSAEGFLRRCLERGRIHDPIAGVQICTGDWWAGPLEMDGKAFDALVDAIARATKSRGQDKGRIGKLLVTMLGASTRRVGKSQQTIRTIPMLEAARDAFAAAMGGEIAWGD